MRHIITIARDEEVALIQSLRTQDTIDAQRVLRFYDMPDLSRTPGNPVAMITEKFKQIPVFSQFDVIDAPEVVGTYETFDVFNFAPDHPARSKSDTYFVNEEKILRTHTTIMRWYYLWYPGIKEKLAQEGEVGALCHGKVYRKDEIDRSHSPIFHQIDGLYICKKEKKLLGRQDLVDVLITMAKAVYGENIERRVNDDSFPYTDPSVEMEIKFGDARLEVLGAGVVHPKVLDNLWVDSTVYNGRAFGPGIERLAMIKMSIPDIRILRSTDPRITKQRGNLDATYQDVSKYPSTYRDISFLVSKQVSLNSYYEIIRDEAGDLVEEVQLLDTYENDAKFWSDIISYTFRIIYRSHERTLINDEINAIQLKIRQKTEEMLWAQLR